MEPAPKIKRNGTGWMSTKFPLELPAALGLTICCPESAAAAAAGRGDSAALCRRAEAAGYCSDLCSYVRMGFAMAAEPEGLLPRPDFLLCCNNICAGMVPWYQGMARNLGVPLFLLDIPYRQREPSPRELAYVQAQLQTLGRNLAALTGQRWDELRFQRACRQSSRTALAWRAVLDTARAEPSPLQNMEIFQYMPQMVTERCDPQTEAALLALADSLRTRLPKPDGPRFRIFWEGAPCWPVLGEVIQMLEQREMQVVADTISQSLCIPCGGWDSLARACWGSINGVPLEEKVRMRAAICRRWRVDGILVHYNRSCRPWCGDLPELERRLRRELGVPVVALEGDQGDPASLSLGQIETRLDTLRELMERRSA